MACMLTVATSAVQGGKEPDNMFLVGLDKPLKQFPFPKLPFAYKDMEPLIDADTMKIHYATLFKNHTTDLNNFIKKWKASGDDKTLAETSLVNMWRNAEKIPENQQEEFYRNAGGYLNHLLYFATMSPPKTNKGKTIPATFQKVIDRSFYNVSDLQSKMIEMAEEDIFGSGWIFLVRAGGYADGDYLTLMVSRDEMSPLTNPKTTPVVALDVWEHAYLKKYGLNRREYFDNWWNTIDWGKAEQIFNWWRKVEGYTEKVEL